MTIAKADFIEGMAKGMAVLESFDTERQRLNATLASQRAGITRAAARRHLLTLAHLGYLETDGSYFWLAPKVLRFSGSYLASARLPRVLQPTLDRLAAQTAESFSAVVLDGDQVVIVARSGSTRVLAYGLHLGARLPAHATSTGRVLLAAKSKAEFNAWMKGRELARLTAHTTVEPRKFSGADRRGAHAGLLRRERRARVGRPRAGGAAAQHAGPDRGRPERGGGAAAPRDAGDEARSAAPAAGCSRGTATFAVALMRHSHKLTTI